MISNCDIKNILISSKNFNSLCSAIYKKSLFNNLESFSYKISYAEDYLVNLEVLSKVNSMTLPSTTLR